jgi:hypothetical protein
MPNWEKQFGLPGLFIAAVITVGGLYLNWQGLSALGWPGSLWALVGGALFLAIVLAAEWQRLQSSGSAKTEPVDSPRPSPPRDDGAPRVSLPPSPDDHRAFISERSASEILRRIRGVKPLQRDALRQTYVGKWVRWKGTIIYIAFEEAQKVFLVQLNENEADDEDSDATIFLEFSPNERHILEPLDEGDRVRFEGKIKWLHDYHVTLRNASFLSGDGD